MTNKEQDGFVIACALGFNMRSEDIELLLAKYGLNLDKHSLIACQEALRDHMGAERYKYGVRLLQVHVEQDA